jgi:hypothetical protein
MNKLAQVSLVALGVGVVAACGDPSPQSTQPQSAQLQFESVDRNNDGVITQQEGLQAPAGFDFTRMDVDKNNSVSRQEFATAMALSRQRG